MVGLLVLAVGALAAVGAWLFGQYRKEGSVEGEPIEGEPPEDEPPETGSADDGPPAPPA
jgi:hypothetical protein